MTRNIRTLLMIAALWAVFLCPNNYSPRFIGIAQATVTSGTNTITYDGDGSTTEFSFPYLFYDEDHLVVTVDGTTKTITTDYTVSGEGESAGGTVTFLSAPADDTDIVIQRVVPYTQGTDFTNYDGYPAEVVEKALDLSAMMASQVGEYSDRTINVPVGTSLTSNDISGTIDGTARLLTISTSGPATALVSSLSESALDTVLASETNGDVLVYNGSDWVNNNAIASLITGSPAQGQVAYINASGDLANLAVGTSGMFLTTAGAGANPAWKDIGDYTDTTITASDKILFSDATASDALKQDTVQGILDLVTSSGAWTLLATATASSSSSLDFTSASVTIDDTYKEYALVLSSLKPGMDNASLLVRTSTDGGGTFDSGASDYRYAGISSNDGSTSPASAPKGSGDTFIQVNNSGIGSSTGEKISGVIYLHEPAAADYFLLDWHTTHINSTGQTETTVGSGVRATAANVDGIRLFMTSGNIASGTARLYGIQKQ